jgi:hypothetical protein
MSATAFYIPAPLIFAALALDALAGDPPWLPHPVVLIGRAISWGEYRLRSAQPRMDFLGAISPLRAENPQNAGLVGGWERTPLPSAFPCYQGKIQGIPRF